MIIDLDTRQLRAGFEGESAPQCVIPFTPLGATRVGDYRQWLPSYKSPEISLEDSVSGYELWRNDLGHGPEDAFDIGLLEDKLERVVREAYNTYLLTDAGTARLVLVLPSLMPHPVLSAVLSVLFGRWKFPTIALMPRPTVCLAAAGLRSGMVVDIGWQETSITSVYEYRELKTSQSVRGMKMLTMQIGKLLEDLAKQHSVEDGQSLQTDLPFVEDFTFRMARCVSKPDPAGDGLELLSLHEPQTISLDWPTETSSKNISFPSSDLTDVVESCLLGNHEHMQPDDEELPLGQLLYNSLLQLSLDVRAICMSRLIFVGKGASIPGLRQRIISSLESTIQLYSWTPIRGSHIAKQRRTPTSIAQFSSTQADARHDTMLSSDNPIEEMVQKQRNKENAQQGVPIQDQIRVLESLGAWAGASLLTSLKVRGVVEIERNKFLEHGMAGASREMEVSVVPQQRTASHGSTTATKAGERSSWTLGSWG